MAQILAYSTAKRQLLALVRKYNQASKGNELNIIFEKLQEEPNRISYTLHMKNPSDKAWEIRRVVSFLSGDIQLDFTMMVNYMDQQLGV